MSYLNAVDLIAEEHFLFKYTPYNWQSKKDSFYPAISAGTIVPSKDCPLPPRKLLLLGQ